MSDDPSIERKCSADIVSLDAFRGRARGGFLSQEHRRGKPVLVPRAKAGVSGDASHAFSGVGLEISETLALMNVHAKAVARGVFKDYSIHYDPNIVEFTFKPSSHKGSYMSVQKILPAQHGQRLGTDCLDGDDLGDGGSGAQYIFRVTRLDGVQEYMQDIRCDSFDEALDLAREEVDALIALVPECSSQKRDFPDLSAHHIYGSEPE